MWGLHPEGRKCGNTYCRYCYTTEHEVSVYSFQFNSGDDNVFVQDFLT
jgi:hypothetical protein